MILCHFSWQHFKKHSFDFKSTKKKETHTNKQWNSNWIKTKMKTLSIVTDNFVSQTLITTQKMMINFFLFKLFSFFSVLHYFNVVISQFDILI